ncbi:MAG: hypothetical protein Kow0026_14500 [Oricola sp.]
MDEYARLIRKIYEAASVPECWDRLSTEIADHVGAGTVHLMLASPSDGTEYLSLFPRGDPGFAGEYLRDYIGLDFRVPRVLSKAPGVLVDERSYVSAEEARRSPIHQEFLPKYQIYEIIGANMTIDGSMGWFGVSTLRPGDDLDNRKKKAFADLTPHILQAYRIIKANRDLQITAQMSLGALDSLNAALFFVRGRKLRHANRAAARIMDDGFLSVAHGRLVCHDPLENGRLARFQDAFDGAGTRQIVVADYLREREYGIRLHASAMDYAGGRDAHAAELVFSIVEWDAGPEVDPAAVEAFCAGRGVTPAELAVLRVVLGDGNLARLARERRVSLDTVQKQRKSAMAKLHAPSQKALVRAFTRFQMLG